MVIAPGSKVRIAKCVDGYVVSTTIYADGSFTCLTVWWDADGRNEATCQPFELELLDDQKLAPIGFRP